MNIIKQKTSLTNTGSAGKKQKMMNNGRRSFIWKAGAVFSATVSSVLLGTRSGHGKTADYKGKVSQLNNRIDQMENSNAIRDLNNSYISSISQGMYEEAVNMFTDDAEVVFNSGIYSGKDTGIHRLHFKFFGNSHSGMAVTPPAGITQSQETVNVGAGNRTAVAEFPYIIQAGIPMKVDCSLVEMARLQGEGIMKWWESGTCKASYIKTDKTWKIRRLEYQAGSSVMYRNGWANPKPVNAPAFSKTYPEDLNGPDRLV